MQTLFEELDALSQDRRLPPVTQWQPQNHGEIDIYIAADGTWWHEGDRIERQPIVDLFATILRLDKQGYALVTPHERLAIRVEDCPFIAVDMECEGIGVEQKLLFKTNVGDYVMADADHPINVQGQPPLPYLLVRDGLLARVSRSVYYRLVEIGSVKADRLLVVSAGESFDLGSVV